MQPAPGMTPSQLNLEFTEKPDKEFASTRVVVVGLTLLFRCDHIVDHTFDYAMNAVFVGAVCLDELDYYSTEEPRAAGDFLDANSTLYVL